MKSCAGCNEEHDEKAFTKDKRHKDGLSGSCRWYRNKYHQQPRKFTKRTGEIRGEKRNDCQQAQNRIATLVRAGIIPRASDLPCIVCWKTSEELGKRFHYDHYLGYEPQHHEKVIPVCPKHHYELTWARIRHSNPPKDVGF